RYEMLPGGVPSGRFAPPSHKAAVDPRLDEVVLRTLEKEPEHRYQHVSELRAALAQLEAPAPRRQAVGEPLTLAVAGPAETPPTAIEPKRAEVQREEARRQLRTSAAMLWVAGTVGWVFWVVC